jgi:hypothetical protein
MKDELKYFEDENFYPFLKRLEQIKYILKRYSLMILFTFLGSIIFMTLFAFSHKYTAMSSGYTNFYTQFENPLLLMTFIFIVLGIILLFRFNAFRDRGMILYEEITDEIDWSRKRKEFMHKPPMELRIVIKEFLKSTDLPFTSSKNGQGLYIILFLLIAISTILIKILV